MKAAVLHQFGQPLVVEDVDLAPPSDDEVRVKIVATGVCHSDLLCRDGGFPIFSLPMVPGHEAAGVVLETGRLVSKVKEGDHVIVCWIPYCGHCWYCRHGEPSLCTDVSNRFGVKLDGKPRLSLNGSPVYHGFDAATFAEEAIFHENAVVKIDDDVPLEAAALIGCAVTTGVGAVINTAKVQEGDRVAVIGCGGVGLNVIQGARIAGAARIIAVDLVSSKLDAAKRFGATDIVDASDVPAHAAVEELTGGVGVDYAFDVTGNTAVQKDGLRLVRRGGSLVLVGVAPFTNQIQINPGIMTIFAQSIIGCYFGSAVPERDFPKLIELWRGGQLELDALITDRGGLQDVNAAFDAMHRGDSLRTVITP